MSATTFDRFLELASELRTKIWQYAIEIHVQDIADKLPRWFERYSWAERRRQAIAGSLPRRDILALNVYIRDPYDGLKLCFEEDEFEGLVDSFPITAVCRETRAHVAQFCQLLAPHVKFKYFTSTLWSLNPPKHGDQPVILRNVHCLPGTDALEHVCSQPTTLTVNAGSFKSAEHLVEMVSRFFGNRVQRLVLDLVVDEGSPVESAYWAHPSAKPIDIEPVLNDDTEQVPSTIHMTRGGKLHVSRTLWCEEREEVETFATHILKVYEIFDVSLERLPHLEHVEVIVEQQGMSGCEITNYATTYKPDKMVGWLKD